MTLDQAFAQEAGTSIPSPDGLPQDAGQCVSWADYALKNVYGFPYLYANAINWWQNLQLAPDFDFISGGYPQTGDFVVWGAGVGSQYGHIDLCAVDGDASGFTGYDSNWEDLPTLREIQHNYEFGILGYIRRKGQDMVDDNITTLGYQIAFNRGPQQGELDTWRGQPVTSLLESLLANNLDERNKAANFDQIQAQLTTAQAEIKQLGTPTELNNGIYKVGA